MEPSAQDPDHPAVRIRNALLEEAAEREHHEESLRQALERLSLAQRAAKIGFWDWNMITGKLTWSPEFFELFGLAPTDEPTFETWLRVMLPDDREPAMAKITRSIEDRTYLENEYRIIRRDGEVCWISAIGNTFYDPDGRPQRMCGICIDITERKHIEEALRKSEEQFRAFVTASSEVVYRMSPDWTEMRHLVGKEFIPDTFSPDSTWLDLYIHPDDQPQVLEVINEAIRTKSTFEMEHRVLRVDGTLGWTHSRALPILGKNGELVEWFGTASDITERKRAEEEVKDANKKLEQVNADFSTITETIRIVNSSHDLYQMLDAIIRVAMERLSYDAGWIFLKGTTGSGVELSAHAGVPDEFVRDWGRIESANYPHNIIFYAGLSRFIENTPVRHPGIADAKILESVDAIAYAGVPIMAGSVVLGGLFIAKRSDGAIPPGDRDVLESIGKEVGSTVLRGMLQERLEDVIEDSTRYIDLLSTDFRARTDTIEQLALSIRVMLDEPAVRLVDNQLQEIRGMKELIENVTTMRRLPATREDLMSVDIDEMVDLMKEQFPSTHIDYTPTGLQALADEFFPVVFSNLIGNSIKFGGPEVHIRIGAEQIDNLIEIRLADNGPGIPDMAKSMLLKSSRDPDQAIPAKCMGLYLIRTLIERYGGSLSLEDRVPGDPSRGLVTCFSLISSE